MTTDVETSNPTPPKTPKVKTLKLPPQPEENPPLEDLNKSLAGIDDVPPATATAVALAREEAARKSAERQTPAAGESEGDSDYHNPFSRPEAEPPQPSAQLRRAEGASDRAKQNKGTPSTKRMGALGAKLPGAEHAKIHKRGEGGHLSLIGTVREKDMTRSQDMEAFVHEFMAPSYGPGLYQVTGVDAVGREFDMGIVDIAIPIGPSAPIVAPPAQDQSALGIIMKMMEQQGNQRQPQADPIDGLMKLHQLKQQMEPGAPQKDNSTVLALIAGVTQVATTVLGVMMQPKGPDPIMALLLAKMLEEKPRRDSDMGMMPPPPPVIDATEQLKNLAAVVTSLRGPEKSSGNDELIAYLLKDRMTPADVLNLVNQVKGERGTDDFKKSMENVGIMLNAAGQIRAQTEPGAGSGFWDAITAMLGNKELAGSAVQAMRGRQQQGADPQLPPQQQPRALGAPPPNDPLVIQARANAEKRLRIEAAELELREKKLSEVQATITPPPQVEAKQLEQADTQPGDTIAKPDRPKLPDNMGDFINAYLEAKTDEEYVEISVEMILSLGEHEDWKPYAEVILSFIANSDRARFLNYMASFLTAMRTVGLMQDELAHKVMKALAGNFPALVEVVQQKMTEGDEGDEDEGGEAPDEALNVIKLGEEAPLTHPV